MSTASATATGRGRTMLSRTATGDPIPSARERFLDPMAGVDRTSGWLVTTAITALAGLLRVWNLGHSPRAFAFDETYYAKDAWSMLHLGYASNYVDNADQHILAGHASGQWLHTPEMIVHPELGKWLIALGEAMFGMNPAGWRAASVVAGTLMVLVMIRLARRVTRSNLLGGVAGCLMTFDGLEFVLSRLALLDIFLAFFMLCAVACLVADRDWGRARLAQQAPFDDPNTWGPTLWWRPWRLAAGLCWGLSLSTKWTAVYLLAALGLLMWAWDSGARRALGVRYSVAKSAVIDAAPAVGYVVLLPLVVYVASWTGWLMHADLYERSLSHTQYGPYWGSYLKHEAHGFPGLFRSLRDLWHYHHDVWAFHTRGLDKAHHVYQSKPEGWLILNRPVGVDAQLNIKPQQQGCTAASNSSCLRQVLLLGTPALWWFATAAFVYSIIAWIGKRDWRYGLVVVGIVATWLPWIQYDERPIFSYYAIATLPFLVLGATMLLGEILGPPNAGINRRRWCGAIAGAIVVIVVVNFAWFWPIYTDRLVTLDQWYQRIWFHGWV